MSNCYLTQEDDTKRVVLVSSKKSNIRPAAPKDRGQVNQVKGMLLEKDKLMKLTDLQRKLVSDMSCDM